MNLKLKTAKTSSPGKLIVHLIALTLIINPNGLVKGQDLGNLKKKGQVKITGSLNAGFNTYNASGAGGNMMPFQWTLGGNVNFNLYGVNLPFSVLVSSQNKNFNSPFSRFGVSPYYKWAKAHLGWRSLNFNPYTLGGQQMLGAGIELTPGKFNFGFMYGRLNHAVTDISLFNNLNNTVPVYNRMGYAFKFGYGGQKANISFSFLNGNDKLNSANLQIKQQTNATAASNQAFGVQGQVKFLKHFTFKADAGISIYTRDIEADSLQATDKIRNNFLIKTGIVPHTNASTRLSRAVNSSLTYSEPKGFAIALQFQHVDPEYKSMGAFYMQTDVEQYTLAPSFRFWGNKAFFTGSFGVQRNNLFKQNTSSSLRTIGMANLMLNPTQNFGVGIQYSNYGISQQVLSQYQNPNPGTPDFYDSIRISQISQSVSISPHYTIMSDRQSQVFSLNAALQNLKDNNNLNKGQSDYTSVTANLNHDWQFLNSNIGINQNMTYINTKTSVNTIGAAGYTVTVSKALVHESNQTDSKGNKKSTRVTLNATGNYFMNLLDGNISGNTVGAGAGADFQFAGHHKLNLNLGWLRNSDKSGGTPDRNEFVTGFRYGYTF